MKILVSNDDGITSPGLIALVKALKTIGDVTVVAPLTQQSAVGHSLTMERPLRVQEHDINGEFFGYSVNGTPSDCVKLALSTLLDFKPNIMVSGINHGQNTAINILYSGTVSAATEGMLFGIPSLAISVASHDIDVNMDPSAEFARKIVLEMKNMNLPKGTLLNVNVPDLPSDKIKGIKITRNSDTIWKDAYEKRTDPFGREYYWFAGEYNILEHIEDSDDIAMQNGYVSVTPVHYNFTNTDFFDGLKSLTNGKI